MENKFKRGDVVRRKVREIKMTVNQYIEGKVECIWFDAQNKLQIRAFNEGKLIRARLTV